jgi:hypothetical protein
MTCSAIAIIFNTLFAFTAQTQRELVGHLSFQTALRRNLAANEANTKITRFSFLINRNSKFAIN